jgi:hypothetical protein
MIMLVVRMSILYMLYSGTTELEGVEERGGDRSVLDSHSKGNIEKVTN